MSFPVWNADPSFNKITSSYFKDLIDLSGNFIIRNGTIKSPANTIEFDDTFSFINFLNSVNIFQQLKLTYNSIEYDVGLQCEKVDTLVSDVATLSPIVSDTQFKLTGQYWDSGISTTVFVNNVSFPSSSISSSSINNTSFVDLLNTQTIAGVKTFNSAPVMSGASISVGTIPINRVSGTAVNTNGTQNIVATKTYTVVQNFSSNIRVDGSLLLSAGTITLTNANLEKIAFLNTATSNIQTQISTINTNLSGYASLSADNTFLSPINTFNNTLNLNGSLKINNTLIVPQSTLFKLEYLQNVSSDIQNQINNINGVTLAGSNVFTALNQFTNNIRCDGSLIVNNNGTILTNDNLNRIQWLSGVSSSVSTSLSNLNTSVSTLNTKTTKMSYMSVGGVNTTTILDGLISQTLSFTNTINNISTTTFAFLSGATENLMTAINNLKTKTDTTNTNLATTTTTANEAKQRTTDIEFSDIGGNQTTISNKCVLDGEVVFNTDLNDITPTTFSYLQGVNSSIQTQIDSKTRIPTGTIIMSVGDSLQNSQPLVWLKCNGQAVSRTTYIDLYQYILSRYGSGDGSTTFNVPNFQACFLRGGMYFPETERVVNGVTYTPNGPLTIQQDCMEAHVHSTNLTGTYLNSTTTNGTHFTGGINRYNTTSFPEFTGGVSSSHRTSPETRPLNHSIYYYIKT
jgi:microcystin-dependent protein